jgi:hypothetical protein
MSAGNDKSDASAIVTAYANRKDPPGWTTQ